MTASVRHAAAHLHSSSLQRSTVQEVVPPRLRRPQVQTQAPLLPLQWREDQPNKPLD